MPEHGQATLRRRFQVGIRRQRTGQGGRGGVRKHGPSKPAWSPSWRAVRRHSDRHVGAPKLMLFDILKLFGLDVRAKIVQARTEFEQRVELAKSRVAHS